ncbi:MAG: hypothetical protein MJZ19_05570 [Paludibacteraceae bacterium]|nr:hypothetical protein [Paludibacteraceae bacterium]
MRKILILVLGLFVSANIYPEKDVKESIVFDDSLTVKDKSEILTAVFNSEALLSYFENNLSLVNFTKDYVIEKNSDIDRNLEAYTGTKKFKIERNREKERGWDIHFQDKDGIVKVKGVLRYEYHHISFRYELSKVNGSWVIDDDTSRFTHMVQ